MPGWAVQQGSDAVLAIFVQPRASKNQLCSVVGDEVKVRLTSPPVDGAANKLCIQFFAKLLGCSKSRISLVSGHKSRHKRLRIEDFSCQQLEQIITELLPE